MFGLRGGFEQTEERGVVGVLCMDEVNPNSCKVRLSCVPFYRPALKEKPKIEITLQKITTSDILFENFFF